MSIRDVALSVDRQNPQLLHTNVVTSVFEYLKSVKRELEAQGYKVAFVGKTNGEGQHRPQGFTPHNVIVNGKSYFITGVSHDALWVNDHQYDFVVAANDENHPIYQEGKPETEEFRIKAKPTANSIDPQWWRPNNPPVELDSPVVVPPPVVIPPKARKSREQFYKEMQELNDFYSSFDGLQRPGGMVLNGKCDVEALAAWGWNFIMEDWDIEKAKSEIRKSLEWRSKH